MNLDEIIAAAKAAQENQGKEDVSDVIRPQTKGRFDLNLNPEWLQENWYIPTIAAGIGLTLIVSGQSLKETAQRTSQIQQLREESASYQEQLRISQESREKQEEIAKRRLEGNTTATPLVLSNNQGVMIALSPDMSPVDPSSKLPLPPGMIVFDVFGNTAEVQAYLKPDGSTGTRLGNFATTNNLKLVENALKVRGINLNRTLPQN